jgi:hypothetical protein
MRELYAQGDLLIERVADVAPRGQMLPRSADGVFVLAEGEVTGHRHVIREGVTFFRDDGLARDVPGSLYIGHINVDTTARIVHEEHGPVTLPKGTYRVRRQRELDPREARLVMD